MLVRPPAVFVSLVASTLALCSTGLAQDAVRVKPAFVGGQQIPYGVAMTLVNNQKNDAGGQAGEKVTVRADLNVHIDEAKLDGSLRASVSFGRVFLDVEPTGDGAGDPRGYEWPMTIPLTDDAPAFKRLGKVLCAAKVTLNVDAAGQVSVVGGLEDFADTLAKMEPTDPLMAGFMLPDQFAEIIEPVFSLDEASAEARTMDKGWVTSSRVQIPEVGTLELLNNWAVGQMDPAVFRYVARTVVTMTQPADKGAEVPTVTYEGASAGATDAEFDRSKNLLRRRKSSLTLRSIWQLGTVTIRQEQFSTIILTLNDGLPAAGGGK